jgi:CMP-N-acetylneuraminic acid synthetase/regulator of RNase E activity RraA
MVKVVAFLPAKGSSERIKNKNTQLLDSKPLFIHTLEKLISCDFIDEVYLDSESEKIFDIASYLNFKKLKRNKNLAKNTTDGNQLLLNEVKHVDADIYIQILCTSPFIEVSTIKKGIDILKKSKSHDSIVLVKKEKQYLWKNGKTKYNINKIPNSEDLPDTTIETMGMYIIKKSAVLKTKRRIGERPFLLEASSLESVDVNYPDDFELAELIQKGKRMDENKFLSNIKNRLSSAILSDILDELGIKGLIKNLKPNINTKILGRAKTLKLRKIKEREDYKKIYGALKSYDLVSAGDIIIVENESSEFAYFGELNANLAIRAGAQGAIIGGKTRDTLHIENLNFPVFSKGLTCIDVKKRAVVESMNKIIKLDDIIIRPEDLIFADFEGVIVIPKEREKEILSKAAEIISKEKNILNDISLNKSIEYILKKNGFF